MIDHISGMRSTEEKLSLELEILRAELVAISAERGNLARENENLKAQLQAAKEPANRLHERIDALAIRDFFKHADRSPHKVKDFNEELTPYHIYDALILYRALYTRETALMAAFRIRFLLINPAVGSADLPSGLPIGVDKSVLAKMNNKDFLAKIWPLLTK